MASVTIQVPTELNNLGNVVQGLVSDLVDGKNILTVVTGVLPVLFQEGAKWEEVKAEVKNPQAALLAGLVLGGIAASLISKKLASAAAVVSAPAVEPAV